MTIEKLPLSTTDAINSVSTLRRRYIQAFIILAVLVSATYNLSQIVSNTWTLEAGAYGAAVIAVCLLLWGLLRWKRDDIAALIVIAGASAFTVIAPSDSYLISGIFAVISAAALSNWTVFAIANVVVFGKGIYELIQLQGTGLEANPDVTRLLTAIIALGVVSAAIRYSIYQAQIGATAAKGSASLLQAVAESGEILAKLLNLKQLLPRAVELIQDRFAFYHVQIFLIDDTGEYAMLAASTGATGQRLMERRHRLAVGSQSVIGRVAVNGTPVIARDSDPAYYRNELLPNTRSELALPIMDGETIIGALDVQSRRADAFDEESIQALQVMANLLGTSIRNARLFDQQERNANETKRLYLEAETNLREIQRLNQQLTRQGWENYLRNRRQTPGITLDQEAMTSESSWSDALVKASQTRQVITEFDNGHSVVAVPVMLGSEVIGAIEVEPGTTGQEVEAAEMMKAIAQRLALSLDKARLFEESQEATAQEQMINDIVARYQSVGNVDELLRITLAELSTSLGAKRGSIRLGNLATNTINGEEPHV